ncbi:MAG: secretin N-terminal domain-containing protein [Cyanobacteria bacterium P01_G01_bin.54]
MRLFNPSFSLFAGATLALVAAQPVQAANTQIVDVQIQRGNGEFRILLTTVGASDRPQVLTVEQGQSLVADILDSRLQVDGNTNGFQTNNPIPGIASVAMTQLDPTTTRIVVTGTNSLPIGQVRQRDVGQIVLGFTATESPDRSAVIQPSTAPAPIPIAPLEPEPDDGVSIDVLPAPAPTPAPDPNAALTPQPTVQTVPTANEQSAIAQLDPEAFAIAQSTPRSDVYVADPEITIDGAPAGPAAPFQPVPTAPPFLPRAVPPNVGDIAVANLAINSPSIDIGSSVPVYMRVENAEVGSVLQSLATMADLNVILGGAGTQPLQGFASAAFGNDEDPLASRISIDLQGEPLQDAFNYILQMSGLDATRKGRTLLIGARLPESARTLVSRTFRLNQADAATVATYMATHGASVQTIFEETEFRRETIDGVTVTSQIDAGPSVNSIEPNDDNNAYLALRGLTVSSDDRLNTVTVTGEERLVELASNFIQQLDVRVRQVAVNVKIIDVNLQNIGRIGTSFSFGINEAGFINQGGIGIINFGDGRDIAPATSNGLVNTSVGAGPVGSISGQAFPDAGDFVAQLQATIENNNAKILSDPTLVVQEGQAATVQLTQEVVTDVNVERDVSDGVTTITVNTETEDVGLTLGVSVSRIDDNGFVSMIITPTVTAVGNTQTINAGGITNTIALVNTRSLESGTVRMRDGQTLVLSGIIQDQDTIATAKLPILGDLPLLGTLFRRTTRQNDRREVIVLVTPNVIEDTQPWGYTYVREEDQQQTGFPQIPQ